MLIFAVPAAVALALAGLVRWRAYEQLVASSDADYFSLTLFSLMSLGLSFVTSLGTYFHSIAIAHVVVQDASGRPMHWPSTSRTTLRRLPRVVTVNVIYGVLVMAVFAVPVGLLQVFLFGREQFLLVSWIYLAAGAVAYSAPQINLYFSAIKLEDRRPKFRRARQLVRGQRAAVLGRVLLCQLVYVAALATWQLIGPEPWSIGMVLLGVPNALVPAVILATAFTLLYVDLTGVSADQAASGEGDAAIGGLETRGNEPAARPNRRGGGQRHRDRVDAGVAGERRPDRHR